MTESVIGEEFLGAETHLLRKLALRLGAVLWILDESGEELRYADEGFVNLWDLTVSELLDDSRAWKHAIHDDDRALALHGLREATQGRPSTSEFRVCRRDGSIQWVRNRAFILEAEDGTLEGLAGVLWDVTEPKVAQLAVERRAALLEEGVKVAKISVWEYELRGPRVLDAVPFRVRAAPGFEGGQYNTLGQVLTLMGVDDVDLARFAHEAQRCAEGQTQEWMLEYQNRRPGMGNPWRVLRGIVSRGPDGKPQTLIGVGYDINAQRQLQEQYRRAKEQQEQAAEIVRLAHWTYRMVDGLVRNARLDLEASTIAPGYGGAPSSDDFVSVVTALGMHKDDIPEVIDAIQACVDGKTNVFQTEYRSTDKAGVMMWRYARGTVARAPDGAPLTFTASAIDITDRRLAEQESRRIKQRQELALRGSGVDLWELELSGLELDANQLFFVHIYEPSARGTAAHGERARAIEVEPADRESVRVGIQAILDGDARDFQVEHRVRQEGGDSRWKLSRGALHRSTPEERPSLIGASVDITDLRRVQDELREAKRLADEANRAKDEFLANVSHEIRTPMNAIFGMTELVIDQPLTRYQRQLLQTSQSATKHLLGIINDLLDFAKLGAGKFKLERAALSLRSTVWDALRALAVRAHRKGLELVCHFTSDVPDALFGDAGRLRQILINIVGNAIKFTEQGEIEVQVSTHGEVPSVGTVTLRVSVRDTGIGIPPDKTQQIFRAFEQQDSSTTRRFGGTGLGLSIAADLVALMHGTVEVESELGRGSTFAFTAKLERDPHAAEVAPRLPPAHVRGLPVLVVDDNHTNRRFLEECLREWQMVPTTVGDGTAAMKALRAASAAGRPYALMLLDSRLPDTDVRSLVTRIRTRTGLSRVKLVLLRTGDSLKREPVEIDAEWLKPIRREDMLEGIVEVLSQSSHSTTIATDEVTEASAGADSLRLDDETELHAEGAVQVLVVDDDEFSASFVRELLITRSYRVTVSGNGREALALLERGGIDLMLLDVRIADTDGFDVMRIVREREHVSSERLPVIALTARSPQQDRDRWFAAGVDAFLSKPVRRAELLAAIARLTAKAGSLTRTAMAGAAASER